MPLTKDQLLIPRVMCVGTDDGTPNYPGSPFKSGDILKLGKSELFYWGVDKDEMISVQFVDQFPHLFRPMLWLEKRNPEDMPMYLSIDGGVFKVDMYDMSSVCSLVFTIDTVQPVPLHNCTPATEQEYNEYQKQKEAL